MKSIIDWIMSLFKTKKAQVIELPIENVSPVKLEPKPEDISPWLTWLIKNQGQKEITGPKHNPWIVDLFKHTSYKTNKDETPWCAACINAALENTGYKGTGSAAAKSFDNFGSHSQLKPGAIITLRHANGGRHVTCLHHIIDRNHIACIGGNQNNQLKISIYNIAGNASGHDALVGCRWPEKKL
jgi:uncharacterized protein (TIGR02594 family)